MNEDIFDLSQIQQPESDELEFNNPTFVNEVEQYGLEEPEKKSKLSKFIESVNIAKDLNPGRLKAIGTRCYEGFLVDEHSRAPWVTQATRAMDLAMQVTTEKTTPWQGAANIKLPTIIDASVKFAARAYSEIIKDNQIVKAKVVGNDPNEQKAKRAERVSNYMSWQLIDKEVEWEPDTDKLLHMLPVVGHVFRKRYYCTAEKRTKSELCTAVKVCINQEASSIESARRVTHIIESVTKNTVVSNIRAGVWLNVDLTTRAGGETSDSSDSLTAEDYFCFLEQHCWLDIDEDGYEEPYIVTLERESNKVVRIVARYDDDGVVYNSKDEVMSITPKSTFTDYIFIPSLDGSYYGMGFGQMLEPLTRVANTLVNQLADSGSLNNMQAGYLSKEVKIKSGRERFELGEWKRTTASAMELRDGVFPLPTREPSSTLFNLLGMMLDLTKDLSSVKDVLAGDTPGNNVPATTVLALIEQGMKTFNAIYKRIYRSMKKEFKQLYDLNYEYLDEDEYYEVLDEQRSIGRMDFEAGSLDVRPVADPNMSSDMQRLAKAEALKGGIGLPGVDPRPVIEIWLEAMKIPKDQIAQILPERDPNGVPPKVQEMIHDAEKKMADVQVKEHEIQLKERELTLKEREFGIKTFEYMSKAIKNIAEAESKEAGTQLSIYQQFLSDTAQTTQVNQPPVGGT